MERKSQRITRHTMGLKIPYYAQSAEFTCGPACVLMIFKLFNPRLRLNRTLEFEIWRQCNMIGVRGADPFGMSVPLLDAGHKVLLVTQRKRMIEVDLWKNRLREYRFTPEDARLALFGIRENVKRALVRGLTVTYGRLTIERIEGLFSEGFIPMALVNMGVVHQYDVPHWVVVTDIGEDHVAFNDPYPPKGGKDIRVSREEFQKMVDDIGSRIGMSPSVLFIKKITWNSPPDRSSGSDDAGGGAASRDSRRWRHRSGAESWENKKTRPAKVAAGARKEAQAWLLRRAILRNRR